MTQETQEWDRRETKTAVFPGPAGYIQRAHEYIIAPGFQVSFGYQAYVQFYKTCLLLQNFVKCIILHTFC